jgi:hypothetical protein
MRIFSRFVQINFIIIFLFLPSCCEKTEPHENIYTDKYTGNWDFHYSWSRTKYGPINITSGESFEYTGTISPASKDNYVFILYSGILLEKKVEPDGTILNTCSDGAPLHWSVSCSGYFEGDSILHYATSQTSPPNQVTDYSTELIGIKKGRNIQCRAPEVSTTAATSVTASGAILNGTVNPNSLSTTVSFQFGTENGSYIYYILATSGVISGSNGYNESVTVSNLISGTKYHFRVKAVNSYGTTYGGDMTFITAK